MLGIIRRAFSFTDWTQHHPNEPPPGNMLDASFAAQDSRIAELEQLVLKVLRDDGRLANEVVGLDSLAPDFLAEFNAILKDSVKAVAFDVRLPAENAVKSGSQAVLAAEKAQIASAKAEIAQNEVESATKRALGLISDVESRIRGLQAVVDKVEARYVTDSQDWDDASSEAQAWAESSAMWAEYMPDKLPDNALKVMDVTGDHWSSRWWANQAANAFGQLTSLYLGVHPTPPSTNNNGGPIQVGSIYYDSTTGQAYVWTGSQWEALYGVNRAGQMTLWYSATAGQTVFPLGLADLHGGTYLLTPGTPEALDPHVNGVKLMPLGAGSAEGDFTVDIASSTVTLLRPLRAGDLVGIDILVPVEQLGPGAVESWKIAPLTGINGTQTVFALTCADVSGPGVTVQRTEELLVSVDGVLQEPTVSYSAIGNTLTFVTAPSADSKVFVTWMRSLGGTGSVDISNVPVTATGGSVARTLPNWFSGTGRSPEVPPDPAAFWSDTPTAGQNPDSVRINRRVFIGQAVDTDDSRLLGSSHQTNWGSYAGWMPRDGDFTVMSQKGTLAISGMSRSSDKAGLSPTPSTWGLGGYVLNDLAGAFARALYLEAQRESGAAGTPAAEITGKNKGNDVTNTAYVGTGNGVDGIWLVGGGDPSYGGTPTAPCNTGIHFKYGFDGTVNYRWNKGIVFDAKSLTGTDGSDADAGQGVIIEAARRHAILWRKPDNTVGAFIRSDVSNAGAGGAFTFQSNAVVISTPAGVPCLQMDTSATAVNYHQFTPTVAANGPLLRAAGTDTNIDLRFRGKGTGGVIFQDGASVTKFQYNTTGVGFFAATPVAKQAVPIAAVDPATTMALVNSVRTALINYGLAV